MSLTKNKIEALLESGDIVRCAACGELSSHSWDHVTEKEIYYRLDFKTGEIANVGATSCFEWGCGHCGASNVDGAASGIGGVTQQLHHQRLQAPGDNKEANMATIIENGEQMDVTNGGRRGNPAVVIPFVLDKRKRICLGY